MAEGDAESGRKGGGESRGAGVGRGRPGPGHAPRTSSLDLGSVLSAPPPSFRRATLLAPPPPLHRSLLVAPPLSQGRSWGGPAPSKPGLHLLLATPLQPESSGAVAPPQPASSHPGSPHLADHAVPDAVDLLPVLAVGDQVEVVAEADGLRQPLQNVDAEALAAPLFRAGGVRRRAAGSEQAWGCWGPPPLQTLP